MKELPRERPPYQLRLGRMFAREAVDKAIVLALFATAFGGTTSYLVLYATKLGIGNIEVYFIVYAVCLLATQPLYGNLADHMGAQKVLAPGAGSLLAAYSQMWYVMTIPLLFALAIIIGWNLRK